MGFCQLAIQTGSMWKSFCLSVSFVFLRDSPLLWGVYSLTGSLPTSNIPHIQRLQMKAADFCLILSLISDIALPDRWHGDDSKCRYRFISQSLNVVLWSVAPVDWTKLKQIVNKCGSADAKCVLMWPDVFELSIVGLSFIRRRNLWGNFLGMQWKQ